MSIFRGFFRVFTIIVDLFSMVKGGTLSVLRVCHNQFVFDDIIFADCIANARVAQWLLLIVFLCMMISTVPLCDTDTVTLTQRT